MADGVSTEQIRVSAGLNEAGDAVVFKKHAVKGEKQKPEEAIVDSKEAFKAGQKAASDLDTHTWFERAYAVIAEVGSKAKTGEALVDGEVEEFNRVMANFPRGEKNRSQALRKDIAAITVDVNERNSKKEKGKQRDLGQDWQDLNNPQKADYVRKNNPTLGLIYDYIVESGGKPAELNWKIVSVYGAVLTESYKRSGQISKSMLRAFVEMTSTGDKNDLYQKLLAREGYSEATPKRKEDKRKWKDDGEREKVLDRMLGLRQPEVTVDPVAFLERQFYERAVRPRLEARRSSAVAYLDKSEEQQKMMIGRPKNPAHFKGGFSPDLAFNVVEKGTVIGGFLDRVGEGAYWRGKACVDVLYWSFYKGQLMGDSQSRSEAKDVDIFSSRKKVSETLRQYAGAVALSYMEKDQKFVDALNILYNLNQGMTYEEKLKILGEKHEFLVNGKIPDELPSYVTDAVMFEKVFVLDALNMSRADLRIVAYHPAQIFDKELATDAEGKVYELLGKNMRLTESPLMKMGWWDASNARFNYEALVPDFRLFNPEVYDDQLDKIWQHCGMYLLELNDRDHSLTRKYNELEEEITIRGKPMTALMGQTGEYLSYQNERIKKKKGDAKGIYDHRRGIFNRIRSMQQMDGKIREQGGQGKVGWNEQLNHKIFKNLTVREAVDIFVRFLSQDLSDNNRLVIRDVVIDKGANEIFYNDELAELLNDFVANPNDPVFADHKNELMNFLIMREVLRDLSRCWGFAFDLNDPEVHQRVFNNQDLTFVENYDIAASESAGLINELTQAASYEDVYAIKITPGKVLEAIEHMKHRRHGQQNYWPMFRLLRFVEMAMMRRLKEMEIASAQDLRKMVDPMGEVQLGAAGKVQQLIGTVDDLWEARNTIISEIEQIGYTEELTLSTVDLQKRGLPGNWREAIKAHALRELASEAFDWKSTRALALEQQAGIDDEIVAGWQWLDREEKSMFPLQSWQIPVAYISHDGETVIEPLAAQGVNRVQLKQYFIDLRRRPDGTIDEEYGIQKGGNVFGGARTAIVVLELGAKFVSKPKEGKPSKNTPGLIPGRQEKVLILQGHTDKEGQQWFKVGKPQEKGEVENVGWIKQEQLKIVAYEAQPLSDPLRYGEVRWAEGRYFWRHFEKEEISKDSPDQWKWIWIGGHWGQDQRRQELVFIPKPSVPRPQLKLGTKDSIQVLVDEAADYDEKMQEYREGKRKKPPLPLLFDRETLTNEFLQETNPKTKRLKEASYPPTLIFAGEKAVKEFYFGRGRMLFSLRMGSPVMAAKTEGFQSGANLPGWMYRTSVAGLGAITRIGDELLKMMRLQIRVGIYRGGLITEIERHFGKVYLPDEVITKLKKTYEKAMTGEQWKEDVEIMRKLITETPFWAVLWNKNYKIKERAGKAAKLSLVDLGNGALKLGSAFLRAKLPIDALPLNMPTTVITAGALGGLVWIGPAGLARSAMIISAFGFSTSYILGMIGVGFSRLIKPDLSRTNPFTLPGIQDFNAYVPVE